MTALDAWVRKQYNEPVSALLPCDEGRGFDSMGSPWEMTCENLTNLNGPHGSVPLIRW